MRTITDIILLKRRSSYVAYHLLAGSALALRDEKGATYPKPVTSTFVAHKEDNWNPVSLYSTPDGWRTIALATKQKLSKKVVDDWIRSSL